MILHVLPLVLAVSSATPSSNRILLMPLSPGEGVSASVADAVGDALAGELRRVPGVRLVTKKDMANVLSVEQQKQLMGCQESACMAELGGALDADRLVTGSVTKLGESWILHLQLMDAKKVTTLASADRRKKGGTIDDLLDTLPGMVKELFTGQTLPPPAAEPEVTAAPTKPSAAKKALSPRWAEVPLENADASKLSLVTDGKGHYLAVNQEDSDNPLFQSPDGQKFFAQRVYASGSDSESYSYNFWEPRGRSEFYMRKGVYTLECGKKKLTLTAVPPAEAKKVLARAKLFKPRWQRQGWALARDDEGTYYYVDQAREPEDNQDFQLFIGEQGSLVPVETRVVANDREGSIFGTPDGKLRISGNEAEWIQGGAHHKLKVVELGQRTAELIYGGLGVYKDEQLGTPCDWAR